MKRFMVVGILCTISCSGARTTSHAVAVTSAAGTNLKYGDESPVRRYDGTPVRYTFSGKAGDVVRVDVSTARVEGQPDDFDPPKSAKILLSGSEISKAADKQSFHGAPGTANGGIVIKLKLPKTTTYGIEYTGKVGSSYNVGLRGDHPCSPDRGVRNNPDCAAGERCLEDACGAPTKDGDPCTGADCSGPDDTCGNQHGDDECKSGSICVFDRQISMGDEGWDGFCRKRR
jgi:hypothetical protein